jgi:hypothetical protein
MRDLTESEEACGIEGDDSAWPMEKDAEGSNTGKTKREEDRGTCGREGGYRT